MRTLQQRGYIAEIGRDPGPGQAVMFGTTRAFLERLGVDALSDLPALGEFVPGADVVEQLERGLRPDSPTIPERLEALEGANARRDLATGAPGRGDDVDGPGLDAPDVDAPSLETGDVGARHDAPDVDDRE
jgi:segregation and condensation protein B